MTLPCEVPIHIRPFAAMTVGVSLPLSRWAAFGGAEEGALICERTLFIVDQRNGTRESYACLPSPLPDTRAALKLEFEEVRERADIDGVAASVGLAGGEFTLLAEGARVAYDRRRDTCGCRKFGLRGDGFAGSGAGVIAIGSSCTVS
jgi:hypothetical protein